MDAVWISGRLFDLDDPESFTKDTIRITPFQANDSSNALTKETKTARQWALEQRFQDFPIYTAYDRDPQRLWMPNGILYLHPNVPMVYRTVKFKTLLTQILGGNVDPANPQHPTNIPNPITPSRMTQLAKSDYARTISKSISSFLLLHRTFYSTFD